MKKIGAWAILFLCVFSMSFVLADNHTDTSKIDNAYQCLEEKVDDCSALTTQELALTIMATPTDDVFDDCVDELKDRRANNNWGNVRDTALAILAMDHAGEDTEKSEEWLLDQSLTPTDLIWYLEQDSNTAAQCNIGYNTQDYTVNIGEDKRIDKNAGTCLTRAQANFWLRINPTCYEEEFVIECDKDFIATLLYKNRDSSTIYVLEGTESSPAYGSITLSVESKCFGSGSCDYEATAWATVALLKKGYDVGDYIPYVIAMSDSNARYLPEAFVYMVTNYDDYASDLVAAVKLGNYWQAPQSVYGKFYDTSLALISLGSSSSEQVTKSKDYLLFSQGSNGCWQNSIRDTAIVLWALEGKAGRSHSGGDGVTKPSVTYCTEAGFFCIPTAECGVAESAGENYFCSSLSETCCLTQNLQSCSALGGSVCSGDDICVGNERKASDTNQCCTGTCQARPQNEETECESLFYSCMDSCSDSQESAGPYACNGFQVCCKAKTGSSDEGSSLNYVIIGLIVAIVLVIVALVWLKRDKLFGGSSSGKSSGGSSGMSIPPRRPGFPPMRRPPMRRPVPPRRSTASSGSSTAGKQRSYDRRDPEMADTFKKLRELSK